MSGFLCLIPLFDQRDLSWCATSSEELVLFCLARVCCCTKPRVLPLKYNLYLFGQHTHCSVAWCPLLVPTTLWWAFGTLTACGVSQGAVKSWKWPQEMRWVFKTWCVLCAFSSWHSCEGVLPPPLSLLSPGASVTADDQRALWLLSCLLRIARLWCI